jgi:hypothetical protein
MDNNISEMDKKVNGDAKPLTRILNTFVLIIDRGRLTLWLLVICSTLLAYFDKIDEDTIYTLFIVFSCLSVGGETVIPTLFSRITGSQVTKIGGANG